MYTVIHYAAKGYGTEKLYTACGAERRNVFPNKTTIKEKVSCKNCQRTKKFQENDLTDSLSRRILSV